jgi:hypothetical protein
MESIGADFSATANICALKNALIDIITGVCNFTLI